MIAPIGVALVIYGLVASQPLLSLLAIAIVLVSIRGRVLFGDRVAHDKLFWIHLNSSIIFLLLLSFLAFVYHSEGLDLYTLAFFAIPFSTGAVLWWRGIKATLSIR
ncbi:MAG TPA: hypothetical protein VMU13_02505 [Candidatus Paceibacterota bacterium]|nr:hypothetical protein [Candidatus Paceibacterota bacterium]